VDEKGSNGRESVEERAGKLLSQKRSAKVHRARQERREAAEHCFGDRVAGG
jgi:hypothetical protein